MFRAFCAGALFGFFFGSSKKGADLRESIDGFLTELTSTDAIKMLDEKRDELSEIASNTLNKINGKFSDGDGKRNGNNGDRRSADNSDENFSPSDDTRDPIDVKLSDEPLDVDKAQELADKLGAKPSAPEDENLAAFHSEDELKSA